MRGDHQHVETRGAAQSVGALNAGSPLRPTSCFLSSAISNLHPQRALLWALTLQEPLPTLSYHLVQPL